MEIFLNYDYLSLMRYTKETLDLFKVPRDQVIFILDSDAYGRPLRAEKASPFDPYIFSINTNLLERYKNYLKVYLSHPDIFPGFGSANKPLIVSSAHFDDNDSLQEELEKMEPFYFDEMRGELYDFLSELLCKILVVHECFHIVNGHLDYICDMKQKHFETHENYQTDISIIDWQTLELDADSCCVCHIMHELRRLKELKKGKQTLSSDYQFVYSIQLIFFIILNCEAVNRKLSGYKDKKHPIESARLNIISGTLHDYGYQQQTLDSFGQVLSECSSIIMKAFGQVHGNLFLGMIKEIIEYNGQIIKNWKNVRPLLEPFAYAELPS